MSLIILGIIGVVLAMVALTAMKVLSKIIMLGIWVVILLGLAVFFFGDRIGLHHGMGMRGNAPVHNTRGTR